MGCESFGTAYWGIKLMLQGDFEIDINSVCSENIATILKIKARKELKYKVISTSVLTFWFLVFNINQYLAPLFYFKISLKLHKHSINCPNVAIRTRTLPSRMFAPNQTLPYIA